MLLAKVACDVLRQPEPPPAEVGVAAVALAEAVRQGLDVPLDAAALLWAAVVRSPPATWASEAALALGLTAKRDLVVEILRTITCAEAGRELRRVGLDVLSEPRAGVHLLDAELLTLVEVARGREIHEVANVIRGVAEWRTVEPTTLKAVVERWASQDDPVERLAAVDIADLLPAGEAAAVLERLLLDDPSPKVREAVVFVLPDVLDDQAALALVERALAHKQHVGVRAELERARGGAG